VRRWALVILGLLALGFLTTFTVVAISAATADVRWWASVRWAPTPLVENWLVTVHTEPTAMWIEAVWVPDPPPPTYTTMIDGKGRIITPGDPGLLPGPIAAALRQGPLGRDLERQIEVHGWPFLAAWCEFQDVPLRPFRGRVIGGIPIDSKPAPGAGVGRGGLRFPRAVPVRPIWPGLIANTVFYAAGWFVLLYGFIRLKGLRRVIRERRGLCPQCGYDLRGQAPGGPHPRPLSQRERGASDAGCPECGWGRSDPRP